MTCKALVSLPHLIQLNILEAKLVTDRVVNGKIVKLNITGSDEYIYELC